MVNATLFKKEWRENAWKHLLFFAVLALLGASLPLLFGWLGKLPIEFGGALGELMRRQLDDFTFYMWANWYGKNLFQVLVIYGVVVGMAQVAGEVGRNTAGFLFSKPLGREAIYRAKFASGAVVMAAVTAAATIITYLTALAVGGNLPALFLAGVPVNVAGLLVIYSLALMFSVMFDDQLKAAAAAFGALLLIAIPGWIPGGYGMFSVFRQMRAWPVYAGDGYQLTAIAVMLLAAWVFYRVGLARLQRKDF